MPMTDLSAAILLLTELGFIFVMLVYMGSNLDDLVIDIIFFGRWIYKSLFVFRRSKPMAIEVLHRAQQQPVALMFPSWQESGIIYSSLSNMFRTLDYSNFHVFVGTYPNDPDTGKEVEKLCSTLGNVHHIITPLPGPTCKADCLNWIVKGITEYEQANGMRFEVIVMQDAEDIVHPLSLKLFNFLIPRFDLVQTPVISLERPWHDLTGGHYMDEFAELHSKEIIVREFLAGVVPGAGVGTAYSRRALDAARTEQGEVFNTGTLTEDYEFSLRLKKAGMKQIFARVPFVRTVSRKQWLTGKEQLVTIVDYICTREYFPNAFWAAVRQKSRWTIGIALQGWRNFGWDGSWAIRYLLMRDRKMVVLSHAAPFGLFVVLVHVGIALWAWSMEDSYQPAPVLPDDSPFWLVVWINQALLAYRLFQRHYWTHKYYGWSAIPMIIPRYLWAIVINYCAVIRALRMFGHHLRTGEKIGWDKTSHEYPDEAHLKLYRRRIGDLMIERQFITPTQLEQALAMQKEKGGTIGNILMEMGLVNQDQFLEVLGMQVRLEVRAIDPFSVPDTILQRFPASLAKQFSMFPVGLSASGNLMVAALSVPTQEQVETVETAIGGRAEFCLAVSSEILFAIHRRYGGIPEDAAKGKGGAGPPLGQRLVEAGVITAEMLAGALREQRRSYKPMGQILLDLDLLPSQATLDDAVKKAAAAGIPLGRWLAENSICSTEDVEKAFALSKKSERPVGVILVEQGHISEQTLTDFQNQGNKPA
ncbi:glycosyl transferase family protein [Haematospirillum jordaniae]|nr:glycosyl transferase family protein [Haematospirillum jordaniae]NKD45919.1 glycosyl transferase family protein [Haematospirillum jordaniae]NKD60071.1 glycosyl transferase family protein [Haematospirillum jordaniae]NKD67994.1 glycosyl transferase family protein [Haematospirillum jordaniae]NKD82182.1 glycosyl transferase family protein [Haematospirillum jordaniae]NKD84262.1 glycosyl transferase family protein [Haematospirillum jordaniae]